MDHQTADTSQAAERYLLGEMSPGEREEFEEHFFACPNCADAIYAGTVFAANARAVFADEGRRTAGPSPSWSHALKALTVRRHWLWAAPACACLVLLGLTIYLLTVALPEARRELARLKTPQSYPAVFLRPLARGDDQVIEASREARFIGISLDVPPQRHYASYQCELIGDAGERRVTLRLEPPARPGWPLNILLPVSALPPGRYTLVLRGQDQAALAVELNRYNFIIQIK